MYKEANFFQQAAAFPGDLIGQTLKRTASGAGHALGKGMAIPAAYAGTALAAGLGIPYGAYKLLNYLGDKGTTAELEKRHAMAQLNPQLGGQVKTGSELLMEKIAASPVHVPPGGFHQPVYPQQRGDIHVGDVTSHIPPGAKSVGSSGGSLATHKDIPGVKRPKPGMWAGLHPAAKWGIGLGGLGLGAYGLHKLLKSPEQPQPDVRGY